MAMVARMPITATTMISSSSVKPRWRRHGPRTGARGRAQVGLNDRPGSPLRGVQQSRNGDGGEDADHRHDDDQLEQREAPLAPPRATDGGARARAGAGGRGGAHHSRYGTPFTPMPPL